MTYNEWLRTRLKSYIERDIARYTQIPETTRTASPSEKQDDVGVLLEELGKMNSDPTYLPPFKFMAHFGYVNSLALGGASVEAALKEISNADHIRGPLWARE